jgi:hypothetical protein
MEKNIYPYELKPPKLQSSQFVIQYFCLVSSCATSHTLFKPNCAVAKPPELQSSQFVIQYFCLVSSCATSYTLFKPNCAVASHSHVEIGVY